MKKKFPTVTNDNGMMQVQLLGLWHDYNPSGMDFLNPQRVLKSETIISDEERKLQALVEHIQKNQSNFLVK